MDNNIELFDSKYIDTKLGLKYLNNNKNLYLKILKNFVNRYKDLEIELLDDEKLKDTLHTIKGLSATLGMTELSQLATTIYKMQNRDKLSNFSKILQLIINELQTKLKDDKQKTILIIDDKVIDIDILYELLVEKFDIIVTLDKKSALESIESEEISTILLEANMLHVDTVDIYNSIKSKMIPIIFITDKSEKIIEEHNTYISKPFHKKELIECIKSHQKS